MRQFEIHVGFPTGSILIGGHSALPVGASSAHARDHRGRPVIPATALRGALRETLEALLRGVGRGACDSGTGIDPQRASASEGGLEPHLCTLDDGERCIACRLFGTRSAALPEGARVFSSLILGDAQLDGNDDVTWGNRQHVAVARAMRSAEDQRLFLRQTPHLRGRQLVASGFTIEAQFDSYLEAAVRATTHLGSGRSVGLARVELKLRWLDELSPAPEPASSRALAENLRIRMTLQSPTLLGGAQVGNNYRPSRTEVPGSVLRGAIGFAIARTLEHPDADPGFAALMDEHTGAQFGFLYPVDPESRNSDHDRQPGPWPLTARACKSHPHDHGVVDTLFDRIAASSLTSVDLVDPTCALALDKCRRESSTNRTPKPCRAPLRSAPGTRGSTRGPSKRVVTRVSIERRRSSAREGALFSYELLEPDAVFEGTIRNIPASARALVNSALELPIHVGRGASSGWGKVRVELLPQREQGSIEERGEAFMQALRAHFEAARLPTYELGRWLPITMLAPLLPEQPDDDGRATLTRELGNVAEWIVVARRFVREGGWDQRSGRPFAELAIAGGAVYVARLSDDWRAPGTLARLQSIEHEGVGRRRHQGYGQTLLFDPFILNRKQDK